MLNKFHKRVPIVVSLLICVFLGGKAQADSCDDDVAAASNGNNQTVETFFANYAIITDWPAFVAKQSEILSPKMTTTVSDHRGTKTYEGPTGYFNSLGDWAGAFETGPDFRVEIVESSPKNVTARLHGAILFKQPIDGKTQIQDDQHHWTEIFSLDDDGKVENLQVIMNLFR